MFWFLVCYYSECGGVVVSSRDAHFVVVWGLMRMRCGIAAVIFSYCMFIEW